MNSNQPRRLPLWLPTKWTSCKLHLATRSWRAQSTSAQARSKACRVRPSLTSQSSSRACRRRRRCSRFSRRWAMSTRVPHRMIRKTTGRWAARAPRDISAAPCCISRQPAPPLSTTRAPLWITATPIRPLSRPMLTSSSRGCASPPARRRAPATAPTKCTSTKWLRGCLGRRRSGAEYSIRTAAERAWHVPRANAFASCPSGTVHRG
mmetsp:Transcript_58564/g.96677  ORF Transcript_58564/g.96677 Transcript_58564/m.96677 type:complete len:207 (+) Transcript_58564:143-763(+)